MSRKRKSKKTQSTNLVPVKSVRGKLIRCGTDPALDLRLEASIPIEKFRSESQFEEELHNPFRAAMTLERFTEILAEYGFSEALSHDAWYARPKDKPLPTEQEVRGNAELLRHMGWVDRQEQARRRADPRPYTDWVPERLRRKGSRFE